MHDRRGHEKPVAALFLVAAAAWLSACGTQAPTLPPGATTGPTTPPLTTEPTSAPLTAAPVTAAPPTAAAGGPACTAADLKASHGIVEGAAGSRITEVVLVTATACSLEAFPTFGLRDENGAAIVGGTAGGTGTMELAPDTSYTSEVRLANWCTSDPAFPVTLELRIGGEELAVSGSSFPEEGNLPPCNGSGAPILEAGAWTAGS